MKTTDVFIYLLLVISIMTACSDSAKRKEKEAETFLRSFEKEIIPAFTDWNKAYFRASISGKDEDYNKVSEYELAYSTLLSDKDKFETVRKFRGDTTIKDSLIRRELDVMYNTMIRYQIDTLKLKSLIDAQVAVEKKLSTFRAEVNGRSLSDNEIDSILVNSRNSDELEKVWAVSKEIGVVVADDVKNLVKLRNEIARDLDYSNYHEMALKISDQDPAEILKLFDELDYLTNDAFADLKGLIDLALSQQLKINPDNLMPWHYQNRFFQEAPKIYESDLDKYYADKDILMVVKSYYEGLGLEVQDILDRSDLFEKPGKYQHAYCTSIDRAGDVRVVANIRNNQQWMNTMLHELGHAVYDKYIDRTLPFALREPAHIFTTEAIANFFGNLASNAKWMKRNLGLTSEETQVIASDVKSYARLEKLVFSRWCQVMFRFEKSMYENPDQDLNTLWWDLVESYQLLKRPVDRDKPDWASKIHVATVPCYYHNYLLGDLLAAQLDAYMANNILGEKDPCFTGHPEIGEYLKEKVFEPGSRYCWNEMIEKATGEKLTAKYYARQYVRK
ncbi:MAG: M2 family metallopeptidase [Bacteroidales bacterium]|nr:M2 family metallopeptidase [Bacteroidales bacterium]